MRDICDNAESPSYVSLPVIKANTLVPKSRAQQRRESSLHPPARPLEPDFKIRARSILVTGTDLVGKTTLINRLVPHLRNSGFKITPNKHDLHKTALMPSIHTLLEAASPEDLLQINSLFFVTFLIDSMKFNPEPDAIIIQDSYVCRTMAFSLAYNLTPITDLFEAFRHHFFSFDVTIHLTATIEARKQRLSVRGNSNSQDHLIITDPAKVSLMDHHLSNIVKTHKEYLQLDTSELTIPQVFETVTKYLCEDISPLLGIEV